MWCLRCYAPVRHLTPREPQLPTIQFLAPKEAVPTSRWHRGATTFGPAGRLTITAVVLLLAPWSTNPMALFVLWPAYLAIAVAVLRSTWRKDFVEAAPTGPEPIPLGPPVEPVRTPVPAGTMLAWAGLAAVAVGVLVASRLVSFRGEVMINIAVIIAGLVLFMRWTLRD
jgi:hypothetical protein